MLKSPLPLLILEQIEVIASCTNGRTILGNPGYISSPYHPSNYHDNTHVCNWMLVAPPGRNITLSFLAFRLEVDDDCDYDYLAITKNVSDVSDVTMLCGTEVQDDIESRGNELYLEFFSDHSENDIGFNISYEITGKNLKSHIAIPIIKRLIS